jgi:uncharacterized membrane protein
MIKILSAIGIVLALYLLWQQIARPAFSPCSINSFINCDAVISGEVAKTLGIPTPLYGLVGYIVLLVAAFARWKKVLLWTSIFGLSFCLWIAYIELVILRVICPICILCQILMLSVFWLSFVLNRQKGVV